MATTVSPAVDGDAQEKAIAQLVSALGQDAVVTSGEDLEFFRDPYGHADSASICGAVVFPDSVEQVQAVVRIANEVGVPLWTSSQGRNNGYGGAAPIVPGSIAVSLRRMNRVLEVNEELAYAIVEPGVRFFDLYDHLTANGHKLLMSTADLGWGSVVGNSLDHGVGYTVYGDHAAAQCGMEVVLANGDILRTGTGGLSDSKTWAAHPRGLGPSPDGLFKQSNFGIVTKMGVWLMPRPERYKACTLFLSERADLEQAVEIMRPFVIDKTIGGLATIGNPVATASLLGPRKQWYDGPGAMPEEDMAKLLETFGIGYWAARIPFYGREEVVEAQYAAFEKAITQIPGAVLHTRTYAGEDLTPENVPWPDQVPAGIPNNELLAMLKWRSPEHGGHAGFAPIVAATGPEAMRAIDIVERVARDHGLDIAAGLGFYGRSILVISALLFDTTDPEQVDQATRACETMVRESGAAGFGEYRAHTNYMDLAAEQYDWNDHAQRRFNETIKDALDPNGILSPGKQGIWPANMRAATPSPAQRS
ncbi:MAG: p-cresol methylhydroxylase [Conexibacter sp.]|nr:p-cresol methylhydroxylase [Conexibacter sp.]